MFWLVLAFLALFSPREHSEQLSNTEKGFHMPQHRGRLPRNICTALGSLEMGVLPDTLGSSDQALKCLQGGRQGSLLRNNRLDRFRMEGGSPRCFDRTGQRITCSVCSSSGI